MPFRLSTGGTRTPGNRRRAEARTHLQSALDIFERLGAAPGEERARSELRATGETARKRDPSTLDQLTPQELQIVRRVAEGATNKEVAAQLFISPRTVAYHLRNVFVKLGISSRAELIRLSGPQFRQDEIIHYLSFTPTLGMPLSVSRLPVLAARAWRLGLRCRERRLLG
jgi:DNA-binding CsgD family transcriptional regulator